MNTDVDIILPDTNTNTKIYQLLYIIETGLRELVIEKLSAAFGSKWYKQCLSVEILNKYKEGIKYERGIKWTNNIPHHPIYYIDYPHLIEIIERNDNWSKTFDSIFGRKDIISSTLKDIIPIRNKVAHNRKATDTDLDIVISSYKKLSAFIGEKGLHSYASKCTISDKIPSYILRLYEESKIVFSKCQGCISFDELPVWNIVSKMWWFDSTYLEHELSPIESYFCVISEYMMIPRIRGNGYHIENWVKSKDVPKLFENANNIFILLLKELITND